jgi:hypothetical protein
MESMAGFAKIAQYLTHPLVLIGFVLMLVFGTYKQLIKSGLLAQTSKAESSKIIKLMLQYGFWLGLIIVLTGFTLQLLTV